MGKRDRKKERLEKQKDRKEKKEEKQRNKQLKKADRKEKKEEKQRNKQMKKAEKKKKMEEKCRFGAWGEWADCSEGKKQRSREITKGSDAKICQRKAIEKSKC